MAITRSSKTDATIRFFSTLRVQINTLLIQQIQQCTHINNSLTGVSQSLNRDDAFLQPGTMPIFGNLIKDVTPDGKAILALVEQAQELLNSYQKRLVASEKTVREMSQKTIEQMHDITVDKLAAELTTLFSDIASVSSNVDGNQSGQAITLSQLLSEISTKLEKASPGTKKSVDETNKTMNALKEQSVQWQHFLLHLNQRANVLLWQENKDKSVIRLRDDEQQLNAALFETDYKLNSLKEIAKEPLSVSKKSPRAADLSKQKTARERLYDQVKQNREEIQKTLQSIDALLASNQTLATHYEQAQALAKRLLEAQSFLTAQLTNSTLSASLTDKINILLKKIASDLDGVQANIETLNTERLKEADVTLLQEARKKLKSYEDYFSVNGQCDQYFSNISKIADGFVKNKSDWVQYYSADTISDETLRTPDLQKTLREHSTKMDAIQNDFNTLKTHLTTLFEQASTIFEKIDSSKQVIASVEPSLKKKQTVVLHDASEIEKAVSVLRDEIRTEEANYALTIQNAAKEKSAREKSVEVKNRGEKPIESKKIPTVKADSDSDSGPDEVIDGTTSPTPAKSAPRTTANVSLGGRVNSTSQSSDANARQISQYFQQRLFSENLPSIGGVLFNKKSNGGQVEKVVLPRFASQMATIFQTSEGKATTLHDTRHVLNNLHTQVRETIKSSGCTRYDKTQSFYHSTERDTHLLERVLNVDVMYLQGKALLALQKITLPDTPSAKASLQHLSGLVTGLQKNSNRENFVAVCVAALKILNAPSIEKEARQYALNCLMLLADINVDKTLKRIKGAIRDYTIHATWETFIVGAMPTFVKKMIPVLQQVTDDDDNQIESLLSVMDIAREAASNNHLSRSAVTQAFYQQIGFGLDYLYSEKHFKVSYSSKREIPAPGEAICFPGKDPMQPWSVSFNRGEEKTYQVKGISADKLQNTGFVGSTPLSHNDMMILGRLADLSLDSQEKHGATPEAAPRVIPGKR